MYETLMEAAVTDENYRLALEAVKRNQGAAGIDRMTTAELEPHLQANWWILKDKLPACFRSPPHDTGVRLGRPHGERAPLPDAIAIEPRHGWPGAVQC